MALRPLRWSHSQDGIRTSTMELFGLTRWHSDLYDGVTPRMESGPLIWSYLDSRDGSQTYTMESHNTPAWRQRRAKMEINTIQWKNPYVETHMANIVYLTKKNNMEKKAQEWKLSVLNIQYFL